MLLGAILFLVYIFLFGDYGAYRIWKQKKEIAQLQQTIEALHLKQHELEEVTERLKNDPEYLEKVAREEYGMIKEGEIIYKIVHSSQEEREMEREEKDESSDEKRPGTP